jgi:hypothetical protein
MIEPRLFATGWVHVFEEDTAEGAVFRPENSDIPLSRRPRERLELHPDGSARILVQGPDDRYVPQPATWHEEGDNVVVRTRGREGQILRIVERSPSRLVVQFQPKSG